MIPTRFLEDLMHLKIVPRSGWISYRISKHDVEPVSSHSYSVATIALTISEIMRLRNQDVSVEKVVRMALLHDLPESLTFDISKAYLRYLGRSGSKLKTNLEWKAFKQILKGLDNRRLARIFLAALEEYSASRSVEARVVHCADALDLLLQVVEYERMGYSKATLDPIWNETRSKITCCGISLASEWSRELERVREKQGRRRRREC